MKKIKFSEHILPHTIAIASFLVVTVIFFSPMFFENKKLAQHDIQQFQGSAKSILDYREKTGEEALWTPSMFSGMPAYMVSVRWGNAPVNFMKSVISLWTPSGANNILIACICYYIFLLAFGVRPYVAIAGALAFAYSSFMIIGLGAGHNARIGAMAFMPLVLAGIHLTFSGKRVLGFAVTAAGLALHLRENHLQVTYYLVLIVLGYGLMQLIAWGREKRATEVFKNLAILVPAALLAACTYFGQFWAIKEYTPYSSRGKSELRGPNIMSAESGLTKDYAFAYKYGKSESMVLLIPDFYGGASTKSLVEDQNSATYKALVGSGNMEQANQLARYATAYWGPQDFTVGSYYAGAIIVFLFVVGILFVEKKYLWWLLPLSALSLMLSWGDSFSTFNYFMFDYFPGYNKFRSVNFALVIVLLAMPLLGMLGVEQLLTKGIDKTTKKKLLIALGATAGLCLLLIVFAGIGSFMKEGEEQLPAWFTKALVEDRIGLFRADAFRSLGFILPVFILFYFNLSKRISEKGFYAALILLITLDITMVDRRYFTKDSFQRKRDNTYFANTPADEAILKDKSYYRVYNLQGAMSEARTSYSHYSIGGYHGAKLRRYQDLYDSCIIAESQQLVADAQSQKIELKNYDVLNMLNTKYVVYGESVNNVLSNHHACGPAWFVQKVIPVNSPTEELGKLKEIDTRTEAVIDNSKFSAGDFSFDSLATIQMTEFTPPYVKYESQSAVNGLAVFSEIYYPEGWSATIDGKEAPILRVNYVLRALAIPAGKHTIEFRFAPKSYTIGNPITTASSWILLVVLLGSLGWSLKEEKKD